jgi:hypothetical protein
MVYRPTVRYADVFKVYVDDLFHVTTLDRNQIMRAALFAAAFSPNFQALMNQYKKGDVLLPSPLWEADHHGYWMDRNPQKQNGGKDVNADARGIEQVKDFIGKHTVRGTTSQEQPNGHQPKEERREREVSSDRIRVSNQGGIRIKIG